MAIKVIASVLQARFPSSTHKLVALALAGHANKALMCWPSVNTLSETCQISHRHVQRILRDLRDLGVLQVLRKGQGRLTTLHRFSLAELEFLPRSRSAPLCNQEDATARSAE